MLDSPFLINFYDMVFIPQDPNQDYRHHHYQNQLASNFHIQLRLCWELLLVKLLLTGLSSSGFTIASSGILRSSGLLILIFQQINL